MFSVEVRDRIMIGHSLPDPFFGPAQNMHGATFVVDVAFFREALNRQNVVVDIGAALDTLAELAAALGNDPNFSATLATQIANRVRFDAAQTLTAPQQTQARANIGAQSAAAIGDPDHDIVADYTAAKA